MDRFVNKIIHGDCLDVMRKIPDKSIDMILCDLPYGTTACKWDTVIPFKPLWEQYERLIKPNSAMVFTACQPFTSQLITSNIKLFKYCMIWKKPQGVDPFMAKIRPLNDYEDIAVFGIEAINYSPQLAKGRPYTTVRDKTPRDYQITSTIMKKTSTINEGGRLPTRVIEFKQEKGLHPTQKPVSLFEYLIHTFTKPGDTVLDNCIGSGTTAVAAYNTGRNFIGIEKEKKYVDIARRRVDEASQQVRMFV